MPLDRLVNDPYDEDSGRSRPKLPEDIFDDCAKLMSNKRHDYTKNSTHENFDRSALIASWFSDPSDKVYVTLIATKLARLASLLGEKKPRNESVRDSFQDLINYSALWADKRS